MRFILVFKGLSFLPGFELKVSAVSQTVTLGEWTHGWRGRAGGTKLERSAVWQLHAEEPAVRSGAGGSRLYNVRGTPKPGHLQPGLGKWANQTIWQRNEVRFRGLTAL